MTEYLAGASQALNRRLAFTFRSLRSRNYRIYFIGQGISLIGTWMQRLAISWLVYRLTGSAFYLGVAEFASQFSAFMLTPLAGALLDRYDIRTALFYTQVFGFVQSLILAVLTISGQIQLWQVIVLCVMLGLINAFDMPGRQTYTIHLVEHKEDLGNAIGLNSTIFNLARLLGPTLAGVTIAALGEGPCFLLNAVSFLPIMVALRIITPNEAPPGRPRPSLLEGIKEGWRYALHSIPIRTILLELSLISLIGLPYVVLLPIIAKETLGGGPSTFGFLMGGLGTGALLGALFIASRAEVKNLVGLIPLFFGIFGLGFMGFALSTNLHLSMLLMVVNGFAMIVGWSSSNTVLQSVVDDDKRGRIMSLYTMSFLGFNPIGSLTAGALADQIGAPKTQFLCGLVCLLATLLLTRSLLAIKVELPPGNPFPTAGGDSAKESGRHLFFEHHPYSPDHSQAPDGRD